MVRKKVERRPADTSRPEKKYSSRMSVELLERLGHGIHNHVVIARRYRDADFSAKRLSEELKANTRYISAAVMYRYGCNYSVLVNRLRIDEAKLMLENPECTLNLDDIAFAVGFCNRQSFYTAFSKVCGVTPRVYRERFRNNLRKLGNNDETIDFISDDSVVIDFE